MEAVYVLEPGAYIRKDGTALKIFKDRSMVAEIPADDLSRLMLVGYVSLSSGVLDYLIQKRIETVFVTPTGRFRARIAIDEHRHVALRKAQYLKLNDPAVALDCARRIVSGKAGNMYRFLLHRARQYHQDAIRRHAARIKALISRIETAADLSILRGMEGLASRIYFEAFPHLIQNPEFNFSGRTRRPPLDPVNAMLSFIYMMLTNEVLSAIKAQGLDPYMGALHEIAYGRPSLACDLVEEYRCFLGDRLVLGLINKKMIRPDDFIYRRDAPAAYADESEMKARRPVEMKPGIARTLIAAYEETMKRSIWYPHLDQKITYRWLMTNQVRRFSEFLETPEKGYSPFVWEG